MRSDGMSHEDTAPAGSSIDDNDRDIQDKNQVEQAYGSIVGRTPALRAMMRQIELVAPTDSAVLILGESGTGKELVAHEIHKRSGRRSRPLVRVNCATVPRELYESEFFGHVKGSFTGALKDRAGRFEIADGGTLFLDEIGEIPLELQSKLLRVLQEKQYERVGDERIREADVRIVAATNRDLAKEVERGHFRQDLYYRLNVYPIPVVPLRHRKEDIPLLVAYFVTHSCKRLSCPRPSVSRIEVDKLLDYDWPGNVRELQNVIERAVILSRGNPLQFDWDGQANGSNVESRAVSVTRSLSKLEVIPELEMRQWEHENLLAALRASTWRVYGPGGAAERLGVRPTTLISRIKKLGLKKPS